MDTSERDDLISKALAKHHGVEVSNLNYIDADGYYIVENPGFDGGEARVMIHDGRLWINPVRFDEDKAVRIKG